MFKKALEDIEKYFSWLEYSRTNDYIKLLAAMGFICIIMAVSYSMITFNVDFHAARALCVGLIMVAATFTLYKMDKR